MIRMFDSLWENNEKLLEIEVPQFQTKLFWHSVGTCIMANLGEAILVCLEKLVGGWALPLWKIWVRQLGLLFPIYGQTKHVPNHQPENHHYSWRNHTLWQTNIAVENGYLIIVDLPMKNGDFP